MKPLHIIVFFALSLSFALPSYLMAQESMHLSEKMRLKEEKKRRKMLGKEKKVKKSEQPFDYLASDPSSKKDRKKLNKKIKKDKSQIPNASGNLSKDAHRQQARRAKYRKGNQGLTKAAKGQMKAEKRRKRRLR